MAALGVWEHQTGRFARFAPEIDGFFRNPNPLIRLFEVRAAAPLAAPNKMKGAWIVISLFAAARALPSPVRRLSSVMDDSTIRTAVTAWLADPTAAETTYGHISTWETSGVTDMDLSLIHI